MKHSKHSFKKCGFPPVTPERVGEFSKRHIGGVAYALQHSVSASCDWGQLTIDTVIEILKQLSQSMDNDTTLASFLELNASHENR